MTTGQNLTTTEVATAWEKAFLALLAISGNVSDAARGAGVSRNTVYLKRSSSPDFAAAWDSALEEAADALELEARRRAYIGVQEPVIHQGKPCGIWVDHTGQTVEEGTPGARQVPLLLRKYSDSLLMFLLKGNRPDKFRERTELTGKDGKPFEVDVNAKHKHQHSVANPAEFAEAFRSFADAVFGEGVAKVREDGAVEPVDPASTEPKADAVPPA